jgi:hypothetical protein
MDTARIASAFTTGRELYVQFLILSDTLAAKDKASDGSAE